MSVIIILIICSLTVASLFAVAFLWSVKTGQFDDPDANAVRILIPDNVTKRADNVNTTTTPNATKQP